MTQSKSGHLHGRPAPDRPARGSRRRGVKLGGPWRCPDFDWVKLGAQEELENEATYSSESKLAVPSISDGFVGSSGAQAALIESQT